MEMIGRLRGCAEWLMLTDCSLLLTLTLSRDGRDGARDQRVGCLAVKWRDPTPVSTPSGKSQFTGNLPTVATKETNLALCPSPQTAS